VGTIDHLDRRNVQDEKEKENLSRLALCVVKFFPSNETTDDLCSAVGVSEDN
jgi:hypothetical protein